MRNSGIWIVLEDRDIITVSLDFDNLATVEKHFIEARCRSFLCKGEKCDFCSQGIPKRIRHQAEILIAGDRYKWEFGEEVFASLLKLPAVEGWVKFTITRLGSGRKARDIINSTDVRDRQKPVHTFRRGRHEMRRY